MEDQAMRRRLAATCDAPLAHELPKVFEDVAIKVPNEDFQAESHGFKVVTKYLNKNGGLLKLEEEWRTHFLKTMKPKFMPELWLLTKVGILIMHLEVIAKASSSSYICRLLTKVGILIMHLEVIAKASSSSYICRMLTKVATQRPEDCDEIQEEIKQLEQKLKEKHDELFELQRNSHRQRYADWDISKGSNVEKESGSFIVPKQLIVTNSVECCKRSIELMSLLSGMEVQSYEADDHCTIVYHMQHASEHQVKHGLKIDMKSGTKTVSASSLPLGFNLSAVLDGFSNVMLPECLVAVRKALILDGSHMEIKFLVRNAREVSEEETVVTLMLDYRVYDIRPKQWSFVETVFKRTPLNKAFRDAFVDGVGPYVLVQQMVPGEHTLGRRKQVRSRPNNPYNDDTFHPEDCTTLSLRPQYDRDFRKKSIFHKIENNNFYIY
ncbi:Exonuclease 3'-5' domain-containing protein 2 [Operophtera brumata]|uniref:Exonuclease 3'-5' domain-containing protein 2 n=1 Tax=Operophtera brumata TaxID=104452 RepID=A0A0L7KRA3_OPEBR|nr:Exonuclease 3'-5' domain-containing protein 2 [Operophtera brumata]